MATKQQNYDALKKVGVELTSIKDYSAEELQHMRAEHCPDAPEDAPGDAPGVNADSEKIAPVVPTLTFATSGWCEELQKSYRRGVYRPATEDEYNALKKYAD